MYAEADATWTERGADRRDTLARQAVSEQWLTPNVPNGGRSVPEATVLAHGMTPKGKRQVELASQVKFWPAPSANDWKGTAKPGQRRGQMDEAAEQRFSRPDPETGPAGSGSSPPTRRLNPLFVSRLMGLPADWTVAGPLASTSYAHWEMQSSHLLRHLLSAYSGDE